MGPWQNPSWDFLLEWIMKLLKRDKSRLKFPQQALLLRLCAKTSCKVGSGQTYLSPPLSLKIKNGEELTCPGLGMNGCWDLIGRKKKNRQDMAIQR